MSDTILRLSHREAQALKNMVDVQIQLEDCGAFVPEPNAKTRDEAMHGHRLPVQDGDAVLYPIACRRNVVALRMGNELGGCRWVADEGIAGSVSCTTCGKTEGPGMYRNEELRSMVDGTYMQTPDPGFEPVQSHDKFDPSTGMFYGGDTPPDPNDPKVAQIMADRERAPRPKLCPAPAPRPKDLGPKL